MNNAAKFVEKLADLFAAVEPAFLADEIKKIRTHAETQTRLWGERLQGKPSRDYRQNRHSPLIKLDVPLKSWEWASGDYDLAKKIDVKDPAVRKTYKLDHPLREEYRQNSGRVSDYPGLWAVQAKLFAAGMYVPDYVYADKLATDYVADAKTHFVTKQSKKLASAVGDRPITKLAGDFQLRGIVTGGLFVEVKGGDKFNVSLDIITNYRYGANSANGEITVYPQFPARYKNVRVGADTKASASEKWMQSHFATS